VINFGVVNYGCICVQGKPLEDVSFINGQLVLPEGTATVRHDVNKSREKYLVGCKLLKLTSFMFMLSIQRVFRL